MSSIRLNVLVNAYACCPGMGSEQGMAWNWISRLAQYCEVYVITESEYETQNLSALSQFEYGKHIHFFFIPVTDEVRRMCWNQGDWRFYPHYAEWQRRALDKAREITQAVDIHVMHQLNMAGFREPGMFYRINAERMRDGLRRIPLVWGPVAGYGSIPFSFMRRGGLRFTAFYLLKNILNVLQMKFHPRVCRMMKESDVLFSCMPEVRDGVRFLQHRDSLLINETGCDVMSTNTHCFSDGQHFRILWVGRFLFTKQLPLALQVIASIRDLPGIEFHIVGKGFTESETTRMHQMAQQLHIDSICRWHGQIPNAEVHHLMNEMDVFLFTSIFEATSTVVLEAIGHGLPIVCFDRCGFGAVVTDRIGRKIPCKTPSRAVKDFSGVIRDLYDHREPLLSMSQCCHEVQELYNWDAKIRRVLEIYYSLSGC